MKINDFDNVIKKRYFIFARDFRYMR